MNIGIVTAWFERGAGYVSRQFADIIGKEHHVFIYARGGEDYAQGDPNWDKPNVYWSRRYNLFDTYMDQGEFCGWIAKHNIQAVIFNEQRYFEPLLWLKSLGVASIAYVDYYTETMLPLFQAYDAIICNTRRHCEAFEGFEQVHYIPWGTDVSLYAPKGDSVKPASDDGRMVFFNSAGTSPARKGTDTFLRAFYACGDIPNIKALVHAQMILRTVMPELTPVIDELTANGRLELVEKSVTAPGLYYKADVYVYPSILDGIGLTVPEAISSGLACIASDNPPMNEFVHEEFGALIPITKLYSRADGYYWPQCRCDTDALASIIRSFAAQPEKVAEMKKNARTYAEQHLSFEKNAEQINNVLQTVTVRDVPAGLKAKIRAFDSHREKAFMLRINQSKVLLTAYELFKCFHP